jgi:hypothetical protein
MVFQVPASKSSVKQNRFEFSLPGSAKVYSVPKLEYVKPSLALQFEDATDVGAARLLFGAYLPEAFGLLEDVEQLGALMEAWKDASGVTPGESGASTGS